MGEQLCKVSMKVLQYATRKAGCREGIEKVDELIMRNDFNFTTFLDISKKARIGSVGSHPIESRRVE